MVKQSQFQFVDKPLVDPETGEVVKSGPDVLSDDALLTYISELKAAMSEMRTEVGKAEAEMVRRMEARQATIYQSDDYQVKLEPQRSYEYNLDKLLVLRDLVDEDTFSKAIKVEYRPNKVQLNKLCKFGGGIRDIIEASAREVPKPPRLSIKRLA